VLVMMTLLLPMLPIQHNGTRRIHLPPIRLNILQRELALISALGVHVAAD
jgi:hypothetical protein